MLLPSALVCYTLFTLYAMRHSGYVYATRYTRWRAMREEVLLP